MDPAGRKRLRVRAARALGVPVSPLWPTSCRLLEVTGPLGRGPTVGRAGADAHTRRGQRVEGAPRQGPRAGVRVRPGGRAQGRSSAASFLLFAVMSSAAAAGSREAAAGAAPGGRRRFMCM